MPAALFASRISVTASSSRSDSGSGGSGSSPLLLPLHDDSEAGSTAPRKRRRPWWRRSLGKAGGEQAEAGGAPLTREGLRRLLGATMGMQKGGWIVPLALLLSTVAYEVAGNRIMVVISGFYESITARDTALYLHTLWLSLLIVLAVAAAKASPF